MCLICFIEINFKTTINTCICNSFPIQGIKLTKCQSLTI